ncbi:hypothetical protein VNO77_45184 [Canavalia gladiata]|uniref:Uncharacterized protein n=1 Tax=Canavalia gladiata TaxID=3824 RepID=A0AAN9JTZ7_CANGL
MEGKHEKHDVTVKCEAVGPTTTREKNKTAPNSRCYYTTQRNTFLNGQRLPFLTVRLLSLSLTSSSLFRVSIAPLSFLIFVPPRFHSSRSASSTSRFFD